MNLDFGACKDMMRVQYWNVTHNLKDWLKKKTNTRPLELDLLPIDFPTSHLDSRGPSEKFRKHGIQQFSRDKYMYVHQ